MLQALKSLRSCNTGLRVYQAARELLFSSGNYIFIAAMPKSGSTFLSNALADLAGYRHSYLAFDYHNVEQELYRPRMIDAYGRGTVVQQHVRANRPNVRLFREFHIVPIVVVRNIFDVVVSVRDHLSTEPLDSFPATYPSESFRLADLGKQLDYVIDFVVPWYFGFYASWHAVEREGRLNFQWMIYEEMIQDWNSAIREVLRICEIEKSDEEIAIVLDNMKKKPRGQTRFNKGVEGRGRETLSEAQRERILVLSEHYPEIGFSRIGIT